MSSAYLPLSLVILCTACAASKAEPTTTTSEAPTAATAEAPAVATSEASAATSTETTPAEPPAAAPKSSGGAPGRPDIVATPVAELKKLTKDQLSAAAKLAKGGDDFDATMAKVKAALGPHTYAMDFADADPSHDGFVWTVTNADGSCDLLTMSVERGGKTVRSLFTGQTKRKYTYVANGEVVVDPCDGQPKK
jgi:hypothetical protein